MEAYNLFLQAEYQRSKRNHNAFTNAMLLYEEVIALDSTFVEAYIGMSDIWQFGGIIWGLYNEQEAWKKSKELLLKAAMIDKDNKQIEYNLHFGYFYFEWDFEAMEEYYQSILSNSDHYNITGVTQDFAIKTGKYDGALRINERFIVNAALINYIYAYRAEILMFMGKKKEAIDVLERYKSLYSDDLFYLRESTKLYFYLGEYERSKNQLNQIRNNFPKDNPPLYIWLDAVYAKMDGKKEDAVLYLDELIHLYKTHKSGSPAWFIALYYCYKKDYNNTFIWLQRSYDRHEVELTWLREEPLLIPVRDDKRYKDLYEKIGFSKIE
jgi:tetratricopeptide (TPR) repeat protein